MQDCISWFHREFDLELSRLLSLKTSITSDCWVWVYTSRWIWRESLSCVITLGLLTTSLMSLSINLHGHSTWTNRSSLWITACHVVVIRNHASLVLITNWCCYKIEITLCCSCTGGSWWQILSTMYSSLVLEVKLCRSNWYVVRALAHISTCCVVGSICLKMFECYFFRFNSLRVLRLDSIWILWTA